MHNASATRNCVQAGREGGGIALGLIIPPGAILDEFHHAFALAPHELDGLRGRRTHRICALPRELFLDVGREQDAVGFGLQFRHDVGWRFTGREDALP